MADFEIGQDVDIPCEVRSGALPGEYLVTIVAAASSLVIRNLDEETENLLRQQAARHQRSMEEEARWILSSAVRRRPSCGKGLGTQLYELSRPGVDLPDVRDRTPHDPMDL